MSWHFILILFCHQSWQPCIYKLRILLGSCFRKFVINSLLEFQVHSKVQRGTLFHDKGNKQRVLIIFLSCSVCALGLICLHQHYRLVVLENTLSLSIGQREHVSNKELTILWLCPFSVNYIVVPESRCRSFWPQFSRDRGLLTPAFSHSPCIHTTYMFLSNLYNLAVCIPV